MGEQSDGAPALGNLVIRNPAMFAADERLRMRTQALGHTDDQCSATPKVRGNIRE
jgi:hypothetical protein